MNSVTGLKHMLESRGDVNALHCLTQMLKVLKHPMLLSFQGAKTVQIISIKSLKHVFIIVEVLQQMK